MAINQVAGTGVQQLADRLMTQLDANRDGKLSSTEFTAFLSQLLGAAGGPPQAIHNHASPTAGPGSYAAMAGFDTGKLNDPSHVTTKYRFARAVQELDLLQAPTSGNLQPIVDRLNQQGMQASVIGTDKIDFGDGHGAIDVIARVGQPSAQWQWLWLDA